MSVASTKSRPFIVLGEKPVASSLLCELATYRRAGGILDVLNIFRKGPYTASQTEHMTEGMSGFLDEVIEELQPYKHDRQSDALLLFSNVEKHNDKGVWIGNCRADFLHIILQGEGVLRFPFVRDKASRELLLRPGLCFIMNPALVHEVQAGQDIPKYGIASLSANLVYRQR